MSEFGEVLELLLAHRWLFQSPVTKILVDQVLDKFPEGWADALESLTIEELNAMVIGGLVREDWPSSLVQFVRKCEEIRKELSKDSFALDAGVDRMEKIPKELIRGLSEKKQHEALLLGQLTHEISEEEGLELIVDLGAGLGYVCQLLHHLFNYKVLGLESNPRIVATANNRRNTLYPLSRSSVNYSCLRVSEDSSGEIEKLVEDFTGDENTNFCLIGLHSCGDLSNNALRLFKEMNRARVLVMMSCCYHKIEWLEDETRFKNFPMSRGLQQELERLENFQGVREVLGRPFMRLACQEPSEKWQDMTPEDHGVHSICVIARGVLELFCHRNNIKLTKMRRKSARQSQCQNFEAYLRNFVLRYNFDGQPLDEKYYEEITQLWEENKSKLRLAEIYTGLQLLLQASAEYLVLNDRRFWLKEQGFSNTRILSVLDRKLSPRSHAIISSKTNPQFSECLH